MGHFLDLMVVITIFISVIIVVPTTLIVIFLVHMELEKFPSPHQMDMCEFQANNNFKRKKLKFTKLIYKIIDIFLLNIFSFL